MPHAIHCRSGGSPRSIRGSGWRPSALATGTRPSPARLAPGAATLGAQAGGDRIAGNTRRQGQRMTLVGGVVEAAVPVPVGILHRPVAQVGDAGAAELAEARERHRVRARGEQPVDAVPAALQRRTVVRRAEKDQRADEARPRLPFRRPDRAGAADHQPSHAVADEDQFAQRHRPARHQRIEQVGELGAVGRDVAPAVVAQVDGAGVEVAREAPAVVVRPRASTAGRSCTARAPGRRRDRAATPAPRRCARARAGGRRRRPAAASVSPAGCRSRRGDRRARR